MAHRLVNMFEKRMYGDSRGNSLPYRLLMPERPGRDKRYPLVLFLHGAGEKGSDNTRQVTNGAEKFATAGNRARYPCFLAVPQCPVHRWWGSGGDGLSEPLRLALQILASLQEEFPVDAERIYITGISMGGFGTFDAVMQQPDYFAAAVPVCGGGDAARAGRIARLPLWIFHGADDPIVPVFHSREMVAALRAAGGAPRYTEYPGVGHASWKLVYRDPQLFAWLFNQRKNAAAPD